MNADTLRWVLFGALIIVLLIGYRNKDTKGAIAGVLGLIILMALLFTSGCAIRPEYRPILQAGLAYEVGSRPVMGRDPVGVIRLYQPIVPGVLGCEYLHLSSVPDERDLNTVDQVGCLVTIPLGR
jgi:hypothetical protein